MEQAVSNLNNETIYSILKNSKGKYVKADRKVIFGNNSKMWQKQVENYINNSIRNNKDINVIAQDGFNYRTAFFEDYNGDYYKINMSIGKNGNINTIYNVGKLEQRKRPVISGSSVNNGANGSLTVNNIPQSNNNVKSDISTKYSMQESPNNTQNISEHDLLKI